MSSEFNVAIGQIVIPEGTNSVFIARLPEQVFSHLLAELIQREWDRVWHEAGTIKPPSLLVMDSTIQLTALTDIELREWGLMRVPGASDGG